VFAVLSTAATTVKVVTSNSTTKTNSTVKTSTVKATATATVNGLTIAQLKDGLARTEVFYAKNGRLPNYVSYGTRHIPIATFKKNLATMGLKINTNLKPVYITSDNINSVSTDTARVNAIVKQLAALGLYAVNWGLGPNTHIQVLESSKVPKNALVVDIYGGADAGLIYEMGTSWYKSIKAARTVFTVYWPTATNITGLAWLARAHDDNYDAASFTGIANPAEYLSKNGYQYVYSGSISAIVASIYKLAIS